MREHFLFQSTPSARRATSGDSGEGSTAQYFNPRPPRGGRPDAARELPDDDQFQSTPSARRATCDTSTSGTAKIFQSTPSARRATTLRTGHRLPIWISIHALREEGDSGKLVAPVDKGLFQSTPSARRATTDIFGDSTAVEFQSTPSARRATGLNGLHLEAGIISIHALREEGDDLGVHATTVQN